MISYYTNSRFGEIADTSTVAFNDPTNIGLAFVLPSSKITKVLSSPLVQSLRDRFTEEHNRQLNQK